MTMVLLQQVTVVDCHIQQVNRAIDISVLIQRDHVNTDEVPVAAVAVDAAASPMMPSRWINSFHNFEAVSIQ